MRVVVSRITGFCGGVRRAIGLAVAATAGCGGRVYVDGALVHNGEVMDDLQRKGIVIYSDGGGDGISWDDCILTRAHGTTAERRARLVKIFGRVVDGTCPHVAAVGAMVRAASKDGRSVIIVGDGSHPEVVALADAVGNDRHFIVNSEGDFGRLPQILHRISVIAQSTIGEDFFREMVEKLRAAHGDIAVLDTICPSSRKRQRAVIDLGKAGVQAIVIVGGHHSSNTATLARIAGTTGLPVFAVETALDLPIAALRRFSAVGVAAGASTDERTVSAVVTTLQKL